MTSIVLLHEGQIAFDGVFSDLRRLVTGHRAGNRQLADLLDQASAQTEILDVEKHRPPIDEVVADLYERWLTRSEFP